MRAYLFINYFRAPKSLTALNTCFDEMEEFKGRDRAFVSDWLTKLQGLQKLSSREGLQRNFGCIRMLCIYGLLTKRDFKMAGDWTEKKSRSINTQKQNEANIQPS